MLSSAERYDSFSSTWKPAICRPRLLEYLKRHGIQLFIFLGKLPGLLLEMKMKMCRKAGYFGGSLLRRDSLHWAWQLPEHFCCKGLKSQNKTNSTILRLYLVLEDHCCFAFEGMKLVSKRTWYALGRARVLRCHPLGKLPRAQVSIDVRRLLSIRL